MKMRTLNRGYISYTKNGNLENPRAIYTIYNNNTKVNKFNVTNVTALQLLINQLFTGYINDVTLM